MNRFVAAVVLALGVCLLGCDAKPATQNQGGLRTVSMQIGDKPFTLEVADNEFNQEHGLMQRDSMPDLHGMVFVFPDEAERFFYMKNTRIPLDILFLDHNGKIVSTATMTPYDLSLVPSNAPAKYAIELNAGAIKQTGVKVGQTLKIPDDAREPKK